MGQMNAPDGIHFRLLFFYFAQLTSQHFMPLDAMGMVHQIDLVISAQPGLPDGDARVNLGPRQGNDSLK